MVHQWTSYRNSVSEDGCCYLSDYQEGHWCGYQTNLILSLNTMQNRTASKGQVKKLCLRITIFPFHLNINTCTNFHWNCHRLLVIILNMKTYCMIEYKKTNRLFWRYFGCKWIAIKLFFGVLKFFFF